MKKFTVVGCNDEFSHTVDWVESQSVQDASDEIHSKRENENWQLIAIFTGHIEDQCHELDY